jgi:hypothetical protein
MEIGAAALVTTVSAHGWLSKAKGRLGLEACGIILGCASISHGVSRDATLAPVRNGKASNAPVPAGSLDVAEARHVLDRFAFGPRPGDTEALERGGFEPWWQAQLAAVPEPDSALDAALAPFCSALVPPAELVEHWREEDADAATDEPGSGLQRLIRPHFKEQLAQLALAELAQHTLSAHQLQEVMVDFWANHFNVFAPKGLLRVLTADYVERVLRPFSLGRFEDLLVATAQHPAMLIYLDNVNGSVQNGGNENYARELLELHTLGVDGGYTQADIHDVARILTGWSVEQPGHDSHGHPFEFRFRAARHDRGPKHVLGRDFVAGGGEEEGVELLRLLAAAPATAHHLARELCARFVADDPPPGCVEAARRAYLDSGGEMRSVLTAIAHDGSFWSLGVRHAKLKTPLELVVSALRISAARFDGSTELAKALGRLGEPLFQESVPRGYSDDSRIWASSGGLLERMDFATSLGFERLPGVRLGAPPLGDPADPESLIAGGNQLLLSGAGSQQTLNAIRAALGAAPPRLDRRELALALFLGSPEFQRQ